MLIYANHCSKCFTDIYLYNFHHISMGWVLLLASFFIGENGGTESLSK